MTLDAMSCLFCLNETDNGLSIFGESEVAIKIRDIIGRYFWFDIDEINNFGNYVCFVCWQQVKSFHEFYLKVEAIYSKSSTNGGTDTETNESDAPSDSEYDSIGYSEEKIIGLQIDLIEASLPEDGAEEELESGIQKTNPTTRKRKRARRSKIRTVEQIVCFMCHKSFKSFDNLRRHYFQHDPKSRIFKCDQCDSRFSRGYLLRNHIKYVHLYPGKYLGSGHRRTTCPVCHKELAYASVKAHIAKMHEKKTLRKKLDKLKCTVCRKEFRGPYLLAQHERTHIDRKLTEVQCDVCEKWVKNRHILSMHMSTHNPTAKKCPHCNKMKSSNRSLIEHISIAHSSMKHRCKECGKAYARPKALREHMSIHTGKSLYSCQYCKKSFNGNANMYKHLRTVHAEQWNIDRAKKKKK